jgi:hypothetical protein
MSGYREHGFRAALHKPFRTDEVEETLRRVLEVPRSTVMGSG